MPEHTDQIPNKGDAPLVSMLIPLTLGKLLGRNVL
jgi:hypothetical protein